MSGAVKQPTLALCPEFCSLEILVAKDLGDNDPNFPTALLLHREQRVLYD